MKKSLIENDLRRNELKIDLIKFVFLATLICLLIGCRPVKNESELQFNETELADYTVGKMFYDRKESYIWMNEIHTKEKIVYDSFYIMQVADN